MRPSTPSCVNFLGKASPVEESGGTSEAAPEVAGAAALVIQAYRKAHGGDTPTPAAVKQILLSTATDLGAPATEQGSGLLNSLKAVELASSMPHCDPVGETLRLSSNQLNYVGRPRRDRALVGHRDQHRRQAQKVAVAGRGFTANSVVRQATVTLSDRRSAHFTSWTGTAANYATVRFTVPAGQALLNSSIAWPSTAATAGHPNKRVRLVLVDPAGQLAAYSQPQGADGYGSAQVLHPAAGTWTAEIFSDTAAAGGTAAAVRFGASVARTSSFGSVSPAVADAEAGRLGRGTGVGRGAGRGGRLKRRDRVRHRPGRRRPGQRPGHAARPGRRRAGGQRHVQRRAHRRQRPLSGRGPGRGLLVRACRPDRRSMLRDLDVNVVLGNDPENQVSAYLVAPGGQTMGYGSNYLATGFTATGVPVESPRRQLSLYTSNPIAGVWTLIIDFTAPVPGNEVADPFTGLIRFNAVRWSRGRLPASARTTLKAGKSYTYQIKARQHRRGAGGRLPRRAGAAAWPATRWRRRTASPGSSCRWPPRPTRRSGSCRP